MVTGENTALFNMEVDSKEESGISHLSLKKIHLLNINCISGTYLSTTKYLY